MLLGKWILFCLSIEEVMELFIYILGSEHKCLQPCLPSQSRYQKSNIIFPNITFICIVILATLSKKVDRCLYFLVLSLLFLSLHVYTYRFTHFKVLILTKIFSHDLVPFVILLINIKPICYYIEINC